MDSKSYAFLDRYAKLQPHSNFLLYHTNFSLTPIELRRKRILAFYLKKLKKFIYSAESDSKLLDVCISILNYLMLSYNPETHKVEQQLLQNLEDLTFIIYLYTQEDSIFNQFFNHLTNLSKRKQKYCNVFHQIQKIVGLMAMTNNVKSVPEFLVSLYNQNSDHMNNVKFSLLLNTFNTLPDQLQLKQYKEKVLKDKAITTDMILDLAKQTQDQETIEEVLNILRVYKNDFHGADSFLIKKTYFQLAYENGDQLDKEEVMECLNADLFDLDYVHQIISYVEFFIDNHKSFVKEIIMKVFEFSYGNNFLWAKLVRLFTKSQEDKSLEPDEEDEQDSENHSIQQMSSQDKLNSDQEMEVEEDSNESGSQKEEREGKRRKKKRQQKESKVKFTATEIETLAKVQYSGKYKKNDLNILKKIVSQNLSPKISENSQYSQFLSNKYTILETLLSINDHPLLAEYKLKFDDLSIQNASMTLK